MAYADHQFCSARLFACFQLIVREMIAPKKTAIARAITATL